MEYAGSSIPNYETYRKDPGEGGTGPIPSLFWRQPAGAVNLRVLFPVSVCVSAHSHAFMWMRRASAVLLQASFTLVVDFFLFVCLLGFVSVGFIFIFYF